MELNLLQSIVLLGYFGEMDPSSQNHDPQKVFQSLQLHILHPMRHKLKDHLGLSYTSFKVFQVLGQFGETEPKYPNYRPRYTDSIPKSLISQFTFNEVSLKLKDYQRIKLHQGIWGMRAIWRNWVKIPYIMGCEIPYIIGCDTEKVFWSSQIHILHLMRS